jgi:uncharacterized protein YaaQ
VNARTIVVAKRLLATTGCMNSRTGSTTFLPLAQEQDCLRCRLCLQEECTARAWTKRSKMHIYGVQNAGVTCACFSPSMEIGEK